MAQLEKRVFLGGTVNGSDWREKLIPMLTVPHFNPVVPDWTPEDFEKELHQRAICEYLLYVLTPISKSLYSVAEVVDDSNKRPERTIFCYLEQDKEFTYSTHELKALKAVGKMIEANGGIWLKSLDEVAHYINHKKAIV